MKAFLIFAFLFVVAMPARAEIAIAPNPHDAEYAALIESSYKMPADFDFAKARELYVKKTDFAPYGVMVQKDFEPFFKLAEEGNEDVLEMVDEYAFRNFPMMEVHSRAMTIYEKFGKADKVAYHAWAAKGALLALLETGDARSPATAVKVVNVSEEYLLARKKGEVKKQELRQEGGRNYDVLTLLSVGIGDQIVMWFDITDIFGRME